MIQKLGKYKIVDKIGEGAMGSVYKAYDSILDRNVAIKIMAEDIKWNPELKLRFYREARAAASLHHLNIVTVYDLGEEGKTTFIVMECLQGKNLKEIIQEKISIPLEKKLSIISQVADGLNHAHLGGFIHRDIKPGNIFVTSNGTAKILDFGIAHIPASNLTRVGDRLGTPIYMSPELVRGAKYDARSDIFSAGIVFYEFLTFNHPFRDTKFDKTLNNILYLEEFPFAEQFPDAPAGLLPILKSCLAKEPDKRYASMAEASAACRALIDELNLAAQRMTKEITALLPNLRLESQRPNAPAKLTRLWAEAQDLLNREQRPDYLSLVHLTKTLAEEPLLQPDATSIMPSIPPKAERPAQPVTTAKESAPKIPAPPVADAFDATLRPAPAAKSADQELDPATVGADQQARTLIGQMLGSSPEGHTPASPTEKQTGTDQREQQIIEEVEALIVQERLDEALDRIRTAMGDLGPTDLLVQKLTVTRQKIEDRNRAQLTQFLNSAKEAVEAKQFSKAIEALDKVLEVEPDIAEAIEMRRMALVEIEAERLRRTRKEEGERTKTSGFKLLAEKKYRESLRAFRQAAELMGEDTTIKAGIGEAEAGIKAEELLFKMQAELSQAQAHLKSGNLDEARSHANRALELAPRNAETKELLAQIDRAQDEKNKKDSIAALIAQSRDAINRRDYDEALSLANEALHQDPSNAQIQDLLQSINQGKEDARKRQEVSDQFARADAAMSRQDFNEAEAQVRSALAIIPDYPDALKYLEKIGKAREQQRIAQEIEKAITEAEQCFQKGDLPQCEAHARRALSLDPKEGRAAELLNRVAQVRETRKREQIAALLKQGEEALAAEDFRKAINCANSILQVEARNAAAEKLMADVRQVEEERKRAKIAECLSLSREALAQGRFENAAGLANEVLALDEKHKEAKALAKEIAKARRKSEKDLNKHQKEFAKADAAYSTGNGTEGAAIVGETYLLETVKPDKTRRMLTRIGLPVLAAAVLLAGIIYWLVSPGGEEAKPAAPVLKISDAQSHLDQKNYDKALEIARQILQSSPADNQAKAIAAEAEKKKRESAIEVLMLEAQNFRTLGQFDQSLNTIQRVLDADPNYQPALEVRTQIQQEMAANAVKTEQDENIKKSLARAASFLTACKLTEAKTEISAIKSEQDKEIQKRLAKVRSLLDACKLKEARVVIDRAKRTDPAIPELDPLGKQLAAATTEYSRIQTEFDKWSSVVSAQNEIAELGSKAELLFKQAKYNECHDVLTQLLSLAPQNHQAQTMSAQVNEARESLKAYEAAMAAKRLPEALSAVDRLEKAHASNPDIAEYRQRADALRKSAKAILNILRIGEAGSLTLDDKPIGSDGEVINSSVGIGSHTLVIKGSGGKQKSANIELFDGANPTYVYNLANMEFSPMTESDREIIKIRKEREKIRTFRVQHVHGMLRGNCTGDLAINGLKVEYRSSQSGGHIITHTFANLSLRVDGDKVELKEVPGNKEVGAFKAQSPGEAGNIKEWWDALEKLGK
jgi:serine/threonine protein kinase